MPGAAQIRIGQEQVVSASEFAIIGKIAPSSFAGHGMP